MRRDLPGRRGGGSGMLAPMSLSRACLLSIALSTAAGCTSDGADASDVIGTYKVTSHREQHQQGAPVACADPGPEVTDGPPYFAVVVDTFLNDPHFLSFQTCTAPGTCEDTIYHFTGGPAGYEDTGANTQTGGGAVCNLYASRYTVKVTGDVAHVELRHWFGSTDMASCTLERAEALRGTPSCESVETWDGTRVK
jgi:hypothetical protein